MPQSNIRQVALSGDFVQRTFHSVNSSSWKWFVKLIWTLIYDTLDDGMYFYSTASNVDILFITDLHIQCRRYYIKCSWYHTVQVYHTYHNVVDITWYISQISHVKHNFNCHISNYQLFLLQIKVVIDSEQKNSCTMEPRSIWWWI